MDANIKTAASCLRRAAYKMQSRINEIRGDELRQKQQESQKEFRIGDDLRQDELTIALNASSKNTDQGKAANDSLKLLGHDQDLRKQRDQLKSGWLQHTDEEEKEIRSLQDQINRLNEIARTLEQWQA